MKEPGEVVEMKNSFTLLLLFSVMYINTEAMEEKKYFYIYDWPKPLRDVYPPPGAVLHPTASYDHDFYENDGFGRTLDRQQGLFATWQFSLFKNLMARLRVSEYRTLDSTKASTFIIPYDMGVHSFIGQYHRISFGTCIFMTLLLEIYNQITKMERYVLQVLTVGKLSDC